MTKLINFYGAPSSGKSTAASDLYSQLKKTGKDVELVTECAKDWVWDDRKIQRFYQIKIVSEQIYREARLFDKVDYIITDSPAPLGCFYEEYYFKDKMIRPMMLEYIKQRDNVIESMHYFTKFDPNRSSEKGRFQTKQESIYIDSVLPKWLEDFNIFVEDYNNQLIPL